MKIQNEIIQNVNHVYVQQQIKQGDLDDAREITAV